MSFLELAKKRYSARQYEPRKVENEKLMKILEAAHVAPTAANRQPYQLIVIQEKEAMDKIKKAANVFNAPLVIIVCGDHSRVWVRSFDRKDHVDVDASIITDHMMLQATELDLGSVWICNFNPDIIKSEFKLPDHLEPVNILAIGYANGRATSPDRHDTMRRSLDEFVNYEGLA